MLLIAGYADGTLAIYGISKPNIAGSIVVKCMSAIRPAFATEHFGMPTSLWHSGSSALCIGNVGGSAKLIKFARGAPRATASTAESGDVDDEEIFAQIEQSI